MLKQQRARAILIYSANTFRLAWREAGGEQGLRRRNNGGVFQAFSFCCCCLRAGRGSSSSPVFVNCEARRLVRVLPTFHPKQRSHQIQLPSDTGFHTSKFSHCRHRSRFILREGRRRPAQRFCPRPSDSSLNGKKQPL